jgi:hypothetical protein
MQFRGMQDASVSNAVGTRVETGVGFIVGASVGSSVVIMIDAGVGFDVGTWGGLFEGIST